MTSIKTIISDKLLRSGWAMLLVSTLIFCWPLITSVPSDQYLTFFAFHFGVGITYYFILLFSRDTKIEEHRIHYQFIKLILFLISAYALNRDMNVFDASPTWFCIVLVLLSVNYLAAIFFDRFPRWCRYLMFFIYGVGLAVFIYLSLYLLPLYAVSIPGLIFLGISVHTFVPLLITIFTFSLTTGLAKKNRSYWASLIAGTVASIVVCIGFSVAWSNHVRGINNNYTIAMAEGEDKLPLWVQVAQQISRDGMTEKILKTDLIYKIPNWQNNFFWSMPGRNFGEQQKLHDPLVVIADLFSNKILLSEDDRIKILESQYNARHQVLERLWTGVNLKTEQVVTTIKVWPRLHLAYSEKLVTLYNHQSRQAWPNQGEGIYTFHLPEGGVVTSLSLWINGKEEKAVLTSKQNATTAYQTVVGYERRDPSVVHWQEGNTVTVRVFPVVSGSSRTFKIGVTAPLRKEDNQLLYDNIWFDGPDASGAQETIKLEVVDGANSLLNSGEFTSNNARFFTKTGSYKPVWTLSFKDAGLLPNAFSFNGYRYSIKPYQRQRKAIGITDVYLDVNEAWSANDIKEVWKIIQQKRVWVYNNNEMQLVNDNNKEALFATLQKQSFSLFPFHLIADKETSVVVSKSGSYSPTISDLESSSFLKSLQAKVDAVHPVKLFSIGAALSPYLQSLRELRCFDFDYGGPDLLAQLLTKNLFISNTETANEIIIHSAGIMITKDSGTSVSSAPDHLMRLFAYNHILEQLSKKDSTSVTDSTALIKEAQEAYVVSPVSSLVVLETQSDYDRFGIKDSESSLKNASLKNKGAVPEPAEWAIIILLGGAFLFFVYKTKLA